MHIAFVLSQYYGLSGVSSHVRELANQLAQRGLSVTVLSSDVDERQSTERLRFVRIRDIPLVPQNLFNFLALYRLNLRHPIDVIHAHDSIPFLGVYPAARLCRVPTVFSVHASIFSPGRAADFSQLTTRVLKFTNRFAARKADGLICVSQEMVRYMLYAGAAPDKIAVIHCPIDLLPFQPAAAPDNDRTCLYVGSLRPTKGVEHLIRAVPAIKKRVPNLNVVIVGDGPLRQGLENLIRELEVQAQVQFTGYVKREGLGPYYQDADVFVLPSLNETLALVILEAMAFGLPVVATNVGGIPEMVKDGYNGLLVPPENPEALAEAVIHVLSDEARRRELSQNALQTAGAHSWTEGIEKYLGVYAALLDEKSTWN